MALIKDADVLGKEMFHPFLVNRISHLDWPRIESGSSLRQLRH